MNGIALTFAKTVNLIVNFAAMVLVLDHTAEQKQKPVVGIVAVGDE